MVPPLVGGREIFHTLWHSARGNLLGIGVFLEFSPLDARFGSIREKNLSDFCVRVDDFIGLLAASFGY